MRIIFFTGILLFQIGFSVPSFSQELNIVFESGFGSYKMKDLKELNKSVLNDLAFDAEQVDNFPAFWNYNSSLMFSFKKPVSLGLKISHASTGSRISRADYSGEYSFDTRTRAFSPGAFIELYKDLTKFRISFRNEAGIEFSKLCLKESIKINQGSSESEYSFTSKNYYYLPSARVSYPVYFLRCGISAGYLIDLNKGDLKGKDTNFGSLNLQTGEKASADWSGMRINISVSYNLLRISRLPVSFR